MSPRHAAGIKPLSIGSGRRSEWGSHRGLIAIVVVVLVVVAYVVVQLVRPVPSIAATGSTVSVTMPGTPAALTWPAQGEAALGVEGTGLLATHGAQAETPLASVTKVMTAYVVLRDHPLTATSQGPAITITPTEVTTYEQDLAAGDSVVAVEAGEQLSEEQALEALLLPSGDNIATVLAVWDAGSASAFVSKMNAEAKALGLAHTQYTDASGVAPGTVSTAEAQVVLAMHAMEIPAFRTIVSMPQVTLPVAGLQYNVDAELGKDGIVGIKTGYTTSAGGCFLFAGVTKVGSVTLTVVGAVLHQLGTSTQPSALTAAFDASTALLGSADRGISQTTAIGKGTVLGHLRAPWATTVELEATRSVALTALAGEHASVTVVLPAVKAPIAAGARLGTAVVRIGDERTSVPLVTNRALPAESFTWRLTNV